jgi:tetratricopeptide (TPR) repeat protein
MKNIHFVRLCLISVFLGMAFLFNGCSVFSYVGDSISQGYENMVSYFNGYYNAKNLFNEAEDEIKAAALSARGKEVPATQANQIPASAKQKFGQVIDKCSNILAFHPSSGFVDNSLLLIGKSFFYQMEYLKAERKFIELLAQFPKSSLALEGQLWYARSEEKLGKLNDGVRLGDATVLAAQTSHKSDIETQAHLLLGVLYHRMNETDKSVAEYEKAISISSDDFVKGEAQISLGDMYFASGQYKKAADAYLRTEDYTSDIYSNYYSKLQASIAFREMGEQKKGLTLINAMIDDFRNREYMPAMLYERANNYASSGRRDDAIEAYIQVDTAYARTEYATRSAYKLGLIFERELGLYAQALKYDSVVNAATGLSIVAEGHRKFIALTRYFDAWHRLNIADSLFLVLSDTTHKNTADTLHTLAVDSTLKKVGRSDSLNRISAIDSLKTMNSVSDTSQRKLVQLGNKSAFPGADSLHTSAVDSALKIIGRIDSLKAINSASDTSQRKPVQTVPLPVLPSADSLRILKSLAAQELGDIFYSEIVVPDSAFYWYNKSLLWNYNNSRSPRILYILAELSRTNPDRKYPVPEEYYTRLDHDFPESMYAEEARRFLQKSSSLVKTDTAAEYYTQAEKQIDAKEFEKAISTLRFLVQSFPKSPFVAKSEYAIGWIMEHRLAQPEKARAQYKRVIKNHEGTIFGQAASKRYTDVQRSDTAKIDTVKLKISPPIQKPMNPDSVLRNATRLEKDTVKQLPVSLPSDTVLVQKKKPKTKPKIEE